MKVYIVMYYYGEELQIDAVFLRMSKAEQHIKNLGNDYFIEEHKVNI